MQKCKDYLINIDDVLEKKMHEYPFRDYLFGDKYIKYGGYDPKNFNLKETLNFFAKRYINPLSRKVDISNMRSCDCACGYGWFTFAFLLMGGSSKVSEPVICIDIDPTREDIITDFARLFGLETKIRFLPGDISSLPFGDREFDLFVSIETLEHVPIDLRRNALHEIARISQYQLLTTPNKIWPIDYHDRKPIFFHWFDGRYLTQFEILKEMNAELLTNVYCFDSWEELESIYPLYWPYPGQEVKNINKLSLLPYKLLSLLSKKAGQYLMPQVQGIYRTRKET